MYRLTLPTRNGNDTPDNIARFVRLMQQGEAIPYDLCMWIFEYPHNGETPLALSQLMWAHYMTYCIQHNEVFASEICVAPHLLPVGYDTSGTGYGYY